ncbi:MAG: PAS domain-containing protein, partial [Planctomycetota bacterium]|nr:PAS domain-containing protein [Planctomycetota bacterium]
MVDPIARANVKQPAKKPAASRASSAAADRAAIIDALSRSQAMIEFQMDGTVLSANDNFLHVMGYSLDEVVGKHHSLFVDEATRQSAAYREFWSNLNRGEFQEGEFRRVARGGREVWLQA